MNLTKLIQTLEGSNGHYILLNKFSYDGGLDDGDRFLCDFFNSDHFSVHSQADFKMAMSAEERKQYLPFPFRVKELKNENFISHKGIPPSTIIDAIKKEYDDQFSKETYDKAFDLGIENSLDHLNAFLPEWESESDFYLLSIEQYEHTSKAIHQTYNMMGYVHAYYYYVVGINLKKKEVISVEIGYE